MNREGLYLLHVSMHGLVHGTKMELGRDSDTGGQIKYVVELARALGSHPDVEKVDVITRQIVDPRVSPDYARAREELSEGVAIIRLPCGPRKYIRKESLWPYMLNFADGIVEYLREGGRMPDFLHGHYADAGLVCSRVSALTGVPMAFTGHSLGRIKKKRLRKDGLGREEIERRFSMGQRIEAEETALASSSFVVTSTIQEAEEQYADYSNCSMKRMIVIPPGVDLSRYRPPSRFFDESSEVISDISKFLSEKGKPAILALSRPDEKKNVETLVKAYGENPKLRNIANMVLVLGSRDDIGEMEKAKRELFTRLLLLIDKYDLWGKVAMPKSHKSEEVGSIYRFAARTRGVFVNPALTEPFGLTLLEAASSGLPVVATRSGGASEIVEKCENGLLIDPKSSSDISAKILAILDDKASWNRFSRMGVARSTRFYSWEGHVKRYIRIVKNVISRAEKRIGSGSMFKRRLVTADRLLVTDIDNTLVGDKRSLANLVDLLSESGYKISFGVATGRSLRMTLNVLREWNIPIPNFMVTDVGSEIFYGQKMVEDAGWAMQISKRWNVDGIKRTFQGISGLRLQGEKGQGRFKVSYYMDPEKAPPIENLGRFLRRSGINANLTFSHGMFLDVLPVGASKGLAIRHLAMKWGIPMSKVMVAGDSGNDEDMLVGNLLGVVVGNHDKELEKLRGQANIYFAKASYAAGIIEGIHHYNFLDGIVKGK